MQKNVVVNNASVDDLAPLCARASADILMTVSVSIVYRVTVPEELVII